METFLNSTTGQGAEEWKTIGGGDYMFPTEYAVAGWFKWIGGSSGWYMSYRLTMNNKTDNQDASRLGDRALALFLHSN